MLAVSRSTAKPSLRSSRSLRAAPPTYPPIRPSDETTRWHGTYNVYGHGIVVQCIADCPCATGGTRSHAQCLVTDHRAARCHARPEPQRVLLSRHQSAEVFHRDGDYRAFVELIDGPRNGPRRRNGSGRRKLTTARNLLEFFDAADKLILPPLPQFFQLFQILFFNPHACD